MSDLAPIIAAVLGPMLLFAVASMRYQHVDSTKTHKLIADSRDLIEKNHKELSGNLGDERERLARIEGYLRISPPPEQGTGDGDGNVKAA